jgi:hypothetical protein
MKELKVLLTVFLALLLSPIATNAVVVINTPPVADAGPDQSVEVGQIATLDASGSHDDDGNLLTYSWFLVSSPPESTAEITDPVAKVTTFTPDLPGAYVVRLVVNDGLDSSEPSTTTVQAVSKTAIITAIEQLKAEIDALQRGAFKYVLAKRLLTLELNLVIASLEMERYRVALILLKNDILPTTDGCFENSVPHRHDWIVDCGAQAIVYSGLQEIIAMVKGML